MKILHFRKVTYMKEADGPHTFVAEAVLQQDHSASLMTFQKDIFPVTI